MEEENGKETNEIKYNETVTQGMNYTEIGQDNVQQEINKYQNKNKNLKIVLIVLIIVAFVHTIFSLFISTINTLNADKPIIYIYPEEEIEVTVSVSNPENLITTYPKYENNWQVIAKPSGDLIDMKTGRKLYSLYWEGKRNTKPNFDEGFVIRGEDTASFLEEKLAILGLNEREAEEFIIYWLPKMENNKYNLIHFETKEEIEKNMELNISPEPDTLIRVYMDFKGLNYYKNVQEQKLEKIERNGYTVVEWGGTEVK